jgi:hypothetical protein
MNQPQVLIITSEFDLHADAVIQALSNSFVNPIRLNSESFIREAIYSFSWNDTGIADKQSLFFNDSHRAAEAVKVIWWRKPKDFHPHPQLMDEWAIKYSQDETKSLIYSLPGLYPDAKWVNNYFDLRFPSQRINQIPIAQCLGLAIPPTLVTNNYKSALDFVAFHADCIVKPMVFSGFMHNDQQYACFTRCIDVDTLNQLHESIALAPLFIQKRICKKAEYRVTIIGDKHFVCRIDAAELGDEDVNIDWRVTDPSKLAHTPDELPNAYIHRLRKMLKAFDLNFGAFDIILGSDGKLYFIELNPNGQWYWVELLTGLPMVNAMVDLIEKLASIE